LCFNPEFVLVIYVSIISNYKELEEYVTSKRADMEKILKENRKIILE
jgi:hypothetical protein